MQPRRVALALLVGLWFFAAPVFAEEVTEAWRSPFGTARSVSVNPTDGSCWAAVGASVMHVTADGSVLSQATVFTDAGDRNVVAVSPTDGTCWALDPNCEGGQVVRLAEDGTELWRIGGFERPWSLSVDPTDGSCWVAGAEGNQVVHLADDGTVLWRGVFAFPASISVNATDGSCWVGSDNWEAPEGDAVLHLAQDGAVLWRGEGFRSPWSLSVNQTDGSCWVGNRGSGSVVHLDSEGHVLSASGASPLSPLSVSVNPSDGSCWVAYYDRVVHLAEDGAVLWGGDEANPRSVSVNPTDGSCWIATDTGCWGYGGSVLHLAADGTELWRGRGYLSPSLVSANPTDGSCWVADVEKRQMFHLAADGTELWQSREFADPCSLCADPRDGSCWVAVSTWNAYDYGGAVLRLREDGTELWRATAFSRPRSVSANPTDGSCWVADADSGQVIHLSAEGAELWRGGEFREPWSVSVNPTDGSCWVVDYGSCQVAHLAETGAELCRVGPFDMPLFVCVNPTDGSCWLADEMWGGVIHLAEDGTELWRPDWRDPQLSMPHSVSVDPIDGSCWVSGEGGVAHIAQDGTWLWYGRDFRYPRSISVNPVDGSCWVADTDNGQVVHLRVEAVPGRFSDLPFLHWAYQQVKTCAEAGLVSGYPDGTYRPTLPVTRDQMAVFVSRALAGGDASVPPGPGHPSFSDVPTAHWAYRYIEYAKTQRVVEGNPGGRYEPDLPVDRAQMAVFMARSLVAPWGDLGLARYTPPSRPTFPDVSPTFWAYKHIEYLAAQGVVGGYSDGRYHPEVIVTRDQMAVFVARGFGLLS